MKTVVYLLLVLSLANESFAQITSPQPTAPASPFSNSVVFNVGKKQFDFQYTGNDGSLKYEYRPNYGGSLQAIRCVVSDTYKFRPSNFGGMGMMVDNTEIFPWSNGVQYKLVSATASVDTLTTRWRMTFGSDTLNYTYRFHIAGRTLVIEAAADDAISQAFFLDRSEETREPAIIHVAYLTLFNLLYTDGYFTSMFFDWEKTNASELRPVSASFSNTSAYFAQTAYYNPNTVEERRAVKETIYLTASPNLHDVLPNIPNPVSPHKTESADRLIFDLWNSPFSSSQRFVEELQDAGIEKLWVINHVWQYGGYDNQYPDVLPANPSFGGDEGLQELSQAAEDAGYLFALHENYIDMYPNAPSWDANHVSLQSDGSLKNAWFNSSTGIQSFQLKPSLADYYLNLFSPDIHAAYSTTASFLDVHSAISPSDAVDYDDTVPSWGSFVETLRQYRRLPEQLRQFHQGPVSGEGGNHLLSVGYYDDIEAQINTGWWGDRSQGQWLPLLVDFDLFKMHEKMAAHGVGYYERFFSTESGQSVYKPYSLNSTLEYIATELAYGHGGFIPTPHMSEDYLQAAQLEQRHVFPAQRLYAQAEVVKILYNDQGEQVDVSEYIRRHPTTYSDINHGDFMSQVRVEYNNGVIVCVNRHPAKAWLVNLGQAGGWFNYHAVIDGKDALAVGSSSRTDYQLPAKSGWVVYSADGPTNVNSEFGSETAPQQFTLGQNYPNPFNSTTRIEFTVPKQAHVSLHVFNLSGQTVATLVDKSLPEGTYSTKLDAGEWAGGMYIYRMTADDFVDSKKLLLIR